MVFPAVSITPRPPLGSSGPVGPTVDQSGTAPAPSSTGPCPTSMLVTVAPDRAASAVRHAPAYRRILSDLPRCIDAGLDESSRTDLGTRRRPTALLTVITASVLSIHGLLVAETAGAAGGRRLGGVVPIDVFLPGSDVFEPVEQAAPREPSPKRVDRDSLVELGLMQGLVVRIPGVVERDELPVAIEAG